MWTDTRRYPTGGRGAHRVRQSLRVRLQQLCLQLHPVGLYRYALLEVQQPDIERHVVRRLRRQKRLPGGQRRTAHCEERLHQSTRPCRRHQLGGQDVLF